MVFYATLCFGLTLWWCWLGVNGRTAAQQFLLDRVMLGLRQAWSPTGDEVLNLLIDAGIVVLVVAVVGGMIGAGLAIIYALLWSLVVLIPLSILMTLWSASPTGAVLATALVAWGVWYLLFRMYRERTLRAAELVLYALGETWRFFAGGDLKGSRPKNRPGDGIWEDAMADHKKRAREASEATREQERVVAEKASEVARATGVAVPHGFNEYSGFFQEVRKRVQTRSLQRTRTEVLRLLEQAVEANEKLLALRRAEAAIMRLPKESNVKELELDAQERELQLKIAKTEAELKALRADGDGSEDAQGGPFADAIRHFDRERRSYTEGDPRRARNARIVDALAHAASVRVLKEKLSPEELADTELRNILRQHGIRLD